MMVVVVVVAPALLLLLGGFANGKTDEGQQKKSKQ